MQSSDLQVDQIIEKVLIRNEGGPYNYAPKMQPHHISSQHIWHFQLQQENQQLNQKLKTLTQTLKKKQQQQTKQHQLEKQVQQLKEQLESTLEDNIRLQKDLNRARLKNSNLQDQRPFFCEHSRRQQSKRDSSCSESKLVQRSPPRKKQTNKLVTIVDSPLKSIIKETKDVSINCHLSAVSSRAVQQKKDRIQALKLILGNQNRLIQAYQQEMGDKGLDKKNTKPSTCRLFEATSAKTFRPISSVGSIVKVNKK